MLKESILMYDYNEDWQEIASIMKCNEKVSKNEFNVMLDCAVRQH